MLRPALLRKIPLGVGEKYQKVKSSSLAVEEKKQSSDGLPLSWRMDFVELATLVMLGPRLS